MKIDKQAMLLYAVTDRSWTQKQTLQQQVELALQGGVTCVQLREKELDEASFLSQAISIKSICEKYNVPLIINDNINVALACNAHGIHIGQKDMDADNVRALVGDDMIIGVSVQTVEQAILAQKMGADYLGVGAVFTTTTKNDANSVNHTVVKEVCNAVDIPVVAIGGIKESNILQLSETDVDGIAVVSAIFSADDIEDKCKQLLMLSKQMVSGHK